MKEEVKHTPGPLFVKQEPKFPFNILTVDKDGREIFHERRHAYGTDQATVAEVMAGSCFSNPETRAAAIESNGRQLADAYLRAAAPDLLAALQAMLDADHSSPFDIVGRDTDGHPLNACGLARVNARALILKATGAA